MTDASTPAADPQKSPLDVLEDILKESQQSTGGADPTATGAPTDPAVAAQEQATKAAEAQAQLEQAQARDQQLLQQQLTDLQQAYKTPEYQEAVRQKTEKQQQDEQHKTDTEGLEIIQLGHKKV